MTQGTGSQGKARALDVLSPVGQYYSEKIKAHGATPKGVDWNDAASQEKRFAQLALVAGRRTAFSLNDIGCGYGALLEFLVSRGHRVQYRGWDISSEMVETARVRHAGRADATFRVGSLPSELADYSVASGIFNVRLGATDSDWLQHIHRTLDEMNQSSVCGFAFNCLSVYSDMDRRRPDLFYADPRELFDLCMTRYARDVALLHDYGLYEFTMLVQKERQVAR